MKNATKHAESLRTLLKKLTRDHPVEPVAVVDPLRALVRGFLASDTTDARADEAMKQIDREFVDLNELRVATDLELHGLIGVRYPQIEKRIAAIIQTLNAIFEKEHTLNLTRLTEMPKRDVRQFVRDLPGMIPFVEAYVMLYAFGSPAIPVDEAIRRYLADAGILESSATIEDAQKFLEHQLKADECYPAFVAIRRATIEEKAKKK